MKRAMRPYRPARVMCAACGQAIRYAEFGGWEHVRTMRLSDPAWHLARTA